MWRVLELARERGVSTARVANELAEARLKKRKFFRHLCRGANSSLARGAKGS